MRLRRCRARGAARQPIPEDREIERLQAEKDKLARKLDRTRKVVEVQGKLSALLEELATEGRHDASERDR